MKNVKSETMKYKCICQKQEISLLNLKEHIYKRSTHKISKINSKIHTKNNSKVSSRIQFLTSTKSRVFLGFIMLLLKLFRYSMYSSHGVELLKKLFYINTKKRFLIDFLSQKPIVKLVTIFKQKKAQLKSNFNSFLHSHTTILTKLIMSKEKNVLISGGEDGRVRMWRSNDLLQITCLGFHYACVSALAINVTENYCLSGSKDANICLWNLQRQGLKTVYEGHSGQILSLAFSKNSSFFFSCSKDKTVRIWKTFQSALIYLIKTDSPVAFISLSSKLKQLVFVCNEGQIKKLELQNTVSFSQKKLKESITSCILSKYNNALITGHRKGRIHLVNIKTLTAVELNSSHSNEVNSIDYCNTKKILATGSRDRTLVIWNALNFQILRQFKSTYIILCIKVTNNQIFSVGISSKIELLNIETDSEIIATPSKRFSESNLAISTKSELVVYCFDFVVRLYDLKLNKSVSKRTFSCVVLSLVITKKGILCGIHTGNVYLLGFASLEIKRNYLLEKESIYFITASSNWNLFAYSTENKTIVKNLRSSTELMVHNSRIRHGKFYLNSFIFMNVDFVVFIFNKKLLEIGKYSCYQLYRLKNSDNILIKQTNSRLTFVDVGKKKNILEVKSLKDLKQYEFKSHIRLTKSYLILSTLPYCFFIN